MGRITDGIAAAASGDIAPLLAAVTSLPSRTGPQPDPWSEDYPPPIPGESFDDVTAAWCAGRLTDAQYQAALDVARGDAKGPVRDVGEQK